MVITSGIKPQMIAQVEWLLTEDSRFVSDGATNASWIGFILMSDISMKSFVFLPVRQIGSLCSGTEGLWTSWWARWGDPMSDPEEPFAEPKTQFNQTSGWNLEMASQSHRLTVPREVAVVEEPR